MKYLLLLPALLLTACADPAHNLYEGIKAQNEAKRTPQERAMTPAPTYDAYKKELKKDNTTTP
ncbi:MAG: hypothetical protein FD173_261 [Gallionellaceae bacterium]|nr:MAG: hypothetical protein FD173_261 [Gallionellaceae bacterium]